MDYLILGDCTLVAETATSTVAFTDHRLSTLMEEVRREVREETGVDVEPLHLTGVYKNVTIGVVAMVFRARYVDGAPTPTDESSAVEWRSPDRVTEGMTEAFAIRIIDALANTDHPAIRHHDGTNLL